MTDAPACPCSACRDARERAGRACAACGGTGEVISAPGTKRPCSRCADGAFMRWAREAYSLPHREDV